MPRVPAVHEALVGGARQALLGHLLDARLPRLRLGDLQLLLRRHLTVEKLLHLLLGGGAARLRRDRARVGGVDGGLLLLLELQRLCLKRALVLRLDERDLLVVLHLQTLEHRRLALVSLLARAVRRLQLGLKLLALLRELLTELRHLHLRLLLRRDHLHARLVACRQHLRARLLASAHGRLERALLGLPRLEGAFARLHQLLLRDLEHPLRHSQLLLQFARRRHRHADPRSRRLGPRGALRGARACRRCHVEHRDLLAQPELGLSRRLVPLAREP